MLITRGLGTAEIMCEARVAKTAAWRRQKQFMHEGVGSLPRDKTQPSHIPRMTPEFAERVVALMIGRPPGEMTRRATPSMAKLVGVTTASAQRNWRANGPPPRQSLEFLLSNDLNIAVKLHDIGGLNVDSSAHAINEQRQVQALYHTQPGSPPRRGRCSTMNDARLQSQRAPTFFAALDLLEGRAIGGCMRRHWHQESFRSLNAIEHEAPAGKPTHLILDSYIAHKNLMSIEWLHRHPRSTRVKSPVLSESLELE